MEAIGRRPPDDGFRIKFNARPSDSVDHSTSKKRVNLSLRSRDPSRADEASTSAVRELLVLEEESGADLRNAGLREIEGARKAVWTRRMRAIIARAQDEYARVGGELPLVTHARDSTLNAEHALRLINMVIGSSSWRTIKVHVYAFLRIELFAARFGTESDTVYPVAGSLVIKYLLFLMDRSLRPTVPSTIRAAAIWVSSKLMMDTDSIDETPFIGAITAHITELRTLNLQVKRVMSIEHVIKLEHLFIKTLADSWDTKALMIGFFLILGMASLRFDDLMHTAPEIVVLVAGALMGVSWQTKVERARRGTKWAMSRGSFGGDYDWVRDWFNLFQTTLAAPRDFFMPAPTRDMCGFHSAPLGYPQAVAIYQSLMFEAGVEACDIINGLHHLRGLMIVLCSYAGHTGSELKVLGNWRTDHMSDVYAGFVRAIPLQMVRRVLGDVRSGWRPTYEGSESKARGSRVELVGESFLEAPAYDGADQDPTKEQIEVARARGKDAIAALVPPAGSGGPAPGSRPAATRSRATKIKELQDAASDSEFSDAEPELGKVVTFWRFPSNPSLNKIHVQNELKPEITACATKSQKLIANMKEVKITTLEFTGKYAKKFCTSCTRARPECFPDGVLVMIKPQ
jgi:hypothetical protein